MPVIPRGRSDPHLTVNHTPQGFSNNRKCSEKSGASFSGKGMCFAAPGYLFWSRGGRALLFFRIVLGGICLTLCVDTMISLLEANASEPLSALCPVALADEFYRLVC